MNKTTVADEPDKIEKIATELAVVRSQNVFLQNAIELLKQREEESTFVTNSNTFVAGYRMAIHDLGVRILNRDLDLGQDMDEPERGDVQPWEDRPF
jgi:hypothetical protein